MSEFKQCRKCKGKNVSFKSGRPIAEPGYIVKKIVENDLESEILEECECHREWRKRKSLELSARRAYLDPRWIDFNPTTDYVGQQSLKEVDRIKTFVSKSLDPNTPKDVLARLESSVIYIYGPNGTQKTTMANWVGYEFLRHGKSVRYILMNDLLKLLQKAERDEEIQDQLEKLAQVDLLIIDEAFDKGKVTLYKSAYQLPFADSFLRNRIQTNRKGILFVSNVSPYDIENNGFGKSIEDFVVRNINIYKTSTDMKFLDNYQALKSTVDVEDLF